MQVALDEEQRTTTTLCVERDEVQNRAKIWEQDLMVPCVDYHHFQDSFNRLTLRFIDLQVRIQECYPNF